MHNKFLKKYYFINKFNKNHLEKLDNRVHIIYRNYKNPLNIKILINLRNFCKKKGVKLYLSNNFKLALKLRMDGVYLPSFNKSTRYNCFKFRKNFDVIGSAHNVMELNTKIRQRVENIFIAPVFKKKTNKLGIYGFLKLRNFTNKNLIILGGVTEEKMNMINFLNAKGFAAINFFQKKRPLKKGALNLFNYL
ncbi:thiamine phosphate synthase [Candidatus Pelagibacter sp.]|nr:thiamine phosphate synthase [Candidatus Pelagibacter sp.]